MYDKEYCLCSCLDLIEGFNIEKKQFTFFGMHNFLKEVVLFLVHSLFNEFIILIQHIFIVILSILCHHESHMYRI